MATRLALRTKVATRVGRSDEGNFASLVNDRFDQFLIECARFYNFKEMYALDTASFTSTNYSVAEPTSTKTGFSSSIHQIVSSIARKATSPGHTIELIVKPMMWLDMYFPDRGRTSAGSDSPRFLARARSTLQLQAPVSETYTVTMLTTHLPAAFAADSTTNPLPELDDALVEAGIAAVYESLEQISLADRYTSKSYYFRDLAVQANEREPAMRFQAEGAIMRQNVGQRFSLSDLQTVYPET